jgi:hypothetical protein
MRRDDHDAWTAGPGASRVAAVVASLARTLDEVAELRLGAAAEADVVAMVDALTRTASRLTAQLSRTLMEADRRNVGDEVGARNTAAWWANRSRVTRGEAGRTLGLAERLDTAIHEPVAAALAAGRLRTDQADVITRAVDDLPDDLVDDDICAMARDVLLDHADDHDARALRIIGKRILDVVAPQVGETHEQRRLELEEAAATATAAFSVVDDGHGRCHGRFTLPSLHGRLLREHLHALASPRRHPTAPGGTEPPRPLATRESLGQALMEYVESYPTDRLPVSAAAGLSLTVTLDLDSLTTGLGAASLSTGERISAGEARRLACRAGLVPAVLGTSSVPLDLGRTARLFNAAQRRALVARDGGCTTQGCGLPPGVCHAHHDDPWAGGGATDLSNGRLLCPRHHRLAHDRRYDMRPHHDHTVTFHRRC